MNRYDTLLLGVAMVIGAVLVTMVLSTMGHCTDCPTGRECVDDSWCDPWSCQLECITIDRYGLEKRCLLP